MVCCMDRTSLLVSHIRSNARRMLCIVADQGHITEGTVFEKAVYNGDLKPKTTIQIMVRSPIKIVEFTPNIILTPRKQSGRIILRVRGRRS